MIVTYNEKEFRQLLRDDIIQVGDFMKFYPTDDHMFSVIHEQIGMYAGDAAIFNRTFYRRKNE